ncbi:TIGR04255 family protein [Micromonospora sp. NPDC005174]|uniref:TIGR04255 family protein n=1 Tax=Micromonospora sp. NPDC005174 TaxID=3157018 RepID=UPI0033BDB975
MASGEKFPNHPIRLVSFELRFPIRRKVATRRVWDAFEAMFGSELPVVELLVREDDETQLPASPNEPVLRLSTAERDRVVTLRYGALTVEMTTYISYEDLRACIGAAVEALESIPATLGITRLGLRYINELQVPSIRGLISDWRSYVHTSLLAALDDPPPDLRPSWLQGGLGFHSRDGAEHTYLAYGPLPRSSVEPDGVLQLKNIDGPCFLLDIDSFLSGPAKAPIATRRKEVLDVVDRLHDSVETVFNWSITEKLRDEVLRVEARDSGDVESHNSEADRV